MSIVIKSAEDLRQLEGWMIKAVTIQPPGVKLTLTHVAAESKLEVTLTPTITPGMVGNVLTVNAGLNLNVQEVPVEKKEA